MRFETNLIVGQIEMKGETKKKTAIVFRSIDPR